MPEPKTRAAAQPLYWWSAAQLAEMTRRLLPVWQQWARDWLVAADPDWLRLQCDPACEGVSLADDPWAILGARESAVAWVQPAGSTAAPWLALLFGSDAGENRTIVNRPVAGAVAKEAYADLMQALRLRLKLVQSETPSPARHLFKPWGGAVIVSLGGDGAGCPQLLLNPELASQLLAGFEDGSASIPPVPAAPRARLHSVATAISDRPVRVRVGLAPCELDLGTLAGLRVGDIIPLPHALDVPLIVSVGNDPLCTGFLGRHGASRAVELVRETSAAPSTESQHPSSLP